MSASPTVNTTGAAAILCVHPKTIEDLIKAGTLPAAKIGRAWVLMTRDVLAYAEKTIVEQTAQRLGLMGRLPRRAHKVAAPASGRRHPQAGKGGAA